MKWRTQGVCGTADRKEWKSMCIVVLTLGDEQ